MTTGFRTSYGGRRPQPNCCGDKCESAGHCQGPLATEKQKRTAVETIDSQAMVLPFYPGGLQQAVVIHMPTSLRRRSGPRCFSTLN